MPPTVRIRIVANVDASLANVFVPLTTAAKRARAAVAEEMGRAGSDMGPYRTSARGAAEETAKIGAAAKHTQTALGTLADGSREKFAQLARGIKELPSDLRTVANEATRELAKIERAQARAALGIGPQPGAAFARSLGGGIGRQMGGPIGGALGREAGGMFGAGAMAMAFPVARLAMGAVSGAARLGGDLLQGIGVNTDISSMFGQQKNLETLATNVSAFGYMPNDPRNNRRVDSSELVREARDIGTKTAIDPTQALEGLQAFVGKTGDLKTGRDAMEDLARLSKASGANLTEMVAAAGDVSNVLGDIPDKGKVIYDVMKQVAGEGKTGAVLIKDLANQMAKVASAAQMFEGDRSKNIGILGAIAQEARGRGGAASATQAATAVQGFTNVFGKHARVEAFKGFGVELRGKTGQLREADDIIVDTLNAAMRGGTKMTKGKHPHAVKVDGGVANYGENWRTMFADVSSQRAVNGFSATYLDAYNASKAATEQGKMADAAAAVRAEFTRLTSSAMTEKEVQDSFARAMATTESKVTIFNDQMAATAGQIEAALLPALVDLAPAALSAAQALAGLVEWLAGKEGKTKVEDDLRRNNVVLAAQDALHGAAVLNPVGGAQQREYTPGAGPLREGDATPGPWAGPTPLQVPAALDEKVTVESQIRETEARKARETFESNRKDALRLTPIDDTERRSALDAAGKGDFSGLKKIAAGEGDWERLIGGSKSATALLEQEQAVQNTQGNADLARQVAQAVKDALASGTMSVHVTNAGEMRPPPTTAPDPNRGDRMPAESQ